MLDVVEFFNEIVCVYGADTPVVATEPIRPAIAYPTVSANTAPPKSNVERLRP